jgi:hypothetical protein
MVTGEVTDKASIPLGLGPVSCLGSGPECDRHSCCGLQLAMRIPFFPTDAALSLSTVVGKTGYRP